MNRKTDNWKIWKKAPHYGVVLYYKRATGELEEMESAKALCEIVRPFYKPGMKVLDVGCAAGHYLRSLKSRVDKNIDYTGLDATDYHIELARKAFGDDGKFLKGDIFKLQFDDNAFDIVMCNNVILHLPPPPAKAISELIRVAKRNVIIRTVFGERNYIIKEVRDSNEVMKDSSRKSENLIKDDGEPCFYNFFNMYSKQYIEEVISGINSDIKIKIIDDKNWKDFDNKEVGGKTATKVINGKQVSGNLILDWKFIILEKTIKKENHKNNK